MTSTNDNTTISGATFNVETDFKFVKPKINKSGGKSVGILNTTSNNALYLSTPLMLTWGVQEFCDEQTGKKTYDMFLQFPQEEYATPETNQFLENMINLQDKIKETAVTNCKEWMNKTKMTPDVVDALWHPMLKYPKDPNSGEPDMTRPPQLRVKLDYWDEEFNCEIYNVESELLFPKKGEEISPMELIPKASNVALVIRCGGLWFANGKFGCTWRLLQAVVKPKRSMKGKCLIQLSGEDMKKMKLQEDRDTDEEVPVEMAPDSDDEGVEAESDIGTQEMEDDAKAAVAEVVEETVTEAPKKKKVVRRKKVVSEA